MRPFKGVLLVLFVLVCAPLTADPATFRYPSELPLIRQVAQHVGVDTALLMAIRQAESGKKYPFGIMPSEKYKNSACYKEAGRPFSSELEKQAVWCAWTIKANQSRWARLSWLARLQYRNDFLRFLGSRYAPIGAGNDPRGLNRNWVRNVTLFFESFAGESIGTGLSTIVSLLLIVAVLALFLVVEAILIRLLERERRLSFAH